MVQSAASGGLYLDIKGAFLSKRMGYHWNRLPIEEGDAPSLSVSRHLDNAFNIMLKLLVNPKLVR